MAKNYWQNNLINKKLYEDYPHDFGLCDIDGASVCIKGKTRLIIYESKNNNEKISASQHRILKILDKNIIWENFDEYSGVFVIKIVNLENDLRWYKVDKQFVRQTTFKELYDILSAKDER